MSISPILKAIEAGHKVKCQVAHEAYDKRMKPARKWVENARRNLTKMEQALTSHEVDAREEERATLTEAQLWRDQAVRAVKGEQPFQMSEVRAREDA